MEVPEIERETPVRGSPGTWSIRIRGLVQGVGFRPFVYRTATACGLKGWVRNGNEGVLVKVSGTTGQLGIFIRELEKRAPAASSVRSVEVSPGTYRSYSTFRILSSRDESDRITEISPDIAVCPECLSDMHHQSHRTAYPLINCTHCGPRFSIIRDLPYDRGNTTMEPFPMCPRCRKEFHDAGDRRFHAQPVACNHCGPVYHLFSGGSPVGEVLERSGPIPGYNDQGIGEVLEWTARALDNDALVAIKGTGGYHLVCSAFSRKAVGKLRKMKQRDGKPFAVMFRETDALRKYAFVSPEEEELLVSWRRPIVLLRKRSGLAPGISDGLSSLGVMLPYMPFHFLLFEKLATPALVMTSGNFGGEPIVISDGEAKEQFGRQVDGRISYNREIHNRVDDSVVMVVRERPLLIRRARGYTPRPVRTDMDLEGILGTGAELTGSFCMGRGDQAIMSQYTGDLKNLETFEFYLETYERFRRLFRFSPRLVVCDLHPDYLSTRFAERLASENGIPLVRVQHHHAHIASVMLDRGLAGEVIGFGFDGTGLGTDGHSWGAEVMRAGYEKFERLYHFEYMPLPGGDRAVEEPWRMGVAYLRHAFGPDMNGLKVPLTEAFGKGEISAITGLIDSGLNTPLASSAGRLFDAVAAITGINYRSTFQAEAPMRLESAVDPSESGRYNWELEGNRVTFSRVIREIVEDIRAGISVGRIAARFHHTLVDLMLHLARSVRSGTGLDRVVLGGGTFQNRYLLENLTVQLEKEKFEVYLPFGIPVNDQGISAGQLAIGAVKKGDI